MDIIKDKALVFDYDNPAYITNNIKKARVLNDNKVIVNWDIEEALKLRELKLDAPSPISREYSWTGKYKPFKHQEKTSGFLTVHRRAFCFNEQGTGKTASAIWAADYLMKKGLVHRVLVICPLSIMDSAWRNDLFTFAMHRTVDVAYGAKKKRKAIIEQGAEFVIINYDGIGVVHDELIAGGFDLIIVDEATHYKNTKTTRWKMLAELIREDTWLWMMTGTPAAQSPLDAYGLAKLVNPTGVPKFASAWKDRVMYRVTQFKWEVKEEATKLVHAALQPAIRFTKDECLDLPAIVYTKRQVELSKQQKTYYEKLRKQMLLHIAGEEITAANAAVNMNKLLQISAGAVYSDNKETFQFDIENRYKVLKEVIDESSKKVLVFLPFRHSIQVVADRLASDNITCELIHGGVTASKRTEIFEMFQNNPNPRVLLIQPQAAAHGVTLTAANTIVWWGPTSSLEIYAQANARIHRSGQDKKCTIVQLQGSPVEYRLYKLLDNRIDVHSKITDLYKELLD